MSGRWTLGEVFVLRHAGFPFDWLEGLGFSESLRSEVAVLLEDERALVEAVRTAGGEDAARSAREALERGREPSLKPRYGPGCQQESRGAVRSPPPSSRSECSRRPRSAPRAENSHGRFHHVRRLALATDHHPVPRGCDG